MTSAQRCRSRNKAWTKFTCPGCGANAWAKEAIKLRCDECDQRMVAAGAKQEQ